MAKVRFKRTDCPMGAHAQHLAQIPGNWSIACCIYKLQLLREILKFQESQVNSFETHFVPASETKNPMIYISHKQYRTNPCVLVTLNCAPLSHIACHTFLENVPLTCLMKEQVITLCAAVPLPLAIV
eukprot:sb/3475453/